MSRLLVFLLFLLPHHGLSRLIGKFAETARFKKALINTFIRLYKVDMSEALLSDVDEFEHFNAFFTRELKPEARPLFKGENTVVCPADGAISQAGPIQTDSLLQAKGRYFKLAELLGGDASLIELFSAGSFATIYLSPRDYHRVHMPLGGQLKKMIYVPGRLFPVNQRMAGSVYNLFARNERVICLFQTKAGPMALVLIGAMIIAGIETVWSGQVCPRAGARKLQVKSYETCYPPIELPAGAEMGRFKSGSTTIVLFGPGTIKLEAALTAGTPVRMGQLLGTLRENGVLNSSNDRKWR